MGILKNGILGPMQGKIANVVGYDLNGQPILRTIGKRTKPLTDKQKNTNQQMKVIMDFIKGMKPLLQTGFNPLAKGTTCNYHNLTIKYNLPNAVTGFYPNVYVDYANFVISKGNLPQPVSPAMTFNDDKIVVTWDTSQLQWPENTDRIMILAYAPATKAQTFTYSGAMRNAGQESLLIPAHMQNQLLHVYISFVSDDRTRAADSLYLGILGG